MRRIRARACGLPLTLACSMPGSIMSLAYSAAPVSFSAASWRTTSVPTIVNSDMLQLPLRLRRQLSGHVEHGLDDLLVAGAAAEVAFDAVLDVVDARARVALEQLLDRHDHAARAEPALHGLVAGQRLLQRRELATGRLALDRPDRRALGLDGEHHARVD